MIIFDDPFIYNLPPPEEPDVRPGGPACQLCRGTRRVQTFVDWDAEDYEAWFLEWVDCPECVGPLQEEECANHVLEPTSLDEATRCSQPIHDGGVSPPPFAFVCCRTCGEGLCSACYEAL